MNTLLHSEEQRIEYIIKLTKDLPQEEEILSHWARYLCVLVAGLIETATQSILSEYSKKHASQEASNFIMSQLKYQSNLNSNKLIQLLGAFSDQWANEFECTLSDSQKDAIDSILANRHNIAHGRSVGISLVRVKDYYSRVSQVLECISNKVLQ